MKRIILLALLIPSLALAQQPDFVRNDNNTSTLNGVNLRASSAAVTDKGVVSVAAADPSSGETQSVIPVSTNEDVNGVATGLTSWYRVGADTSETGSTTTVINATAHAARVNDAIQFLDGGAASLNGAAYGFVTAITANTITISPALSEAAANGNNFLILRPTLLKASDPTQATNGMSGLGVVVDSSFRLGGSSTQATNLLKLEDAAAASGDALVGVAGVVNQGLTSKAADGDYTAPALDTAGGVYLSVGTGLSPLVLEDNVAANGDALTKVAAVTNSALAATSATNGDWTWIKADELGRTITTLAPAGESWQACSDAEAGTANNQIKAAVASNRIYVTSIDCFNTSAVESLININDGSTQIYGQYLTASTGNHPTWSQTFPVPLRGSVNTALNYQMGTTSTTTRCCASGYISVN